MERLAGELAVVDLRTIIRSLMTERESGVLEVTVEEGKRRLFFLEGNLYMPPANPLATQILAQLRQPGGEAKVQELMGRIGAVIHRWRDGFFTFDPGRSSVPPDALGPLPTVELVRAAAVIDETEDELLLRLGGESAEWSVPRGRELPNVRLPAEEAHLLDRLSEATKLGALLARAADRREVLARLCRLEALSLIERRRVESSVQALITPELRDRFLARVAEELEVRPVQLDTATHRARLANLLGRLGEITHYELLGVSGSADAGTVHGAYAEVARLAHPSHAFRLGLEGREEALAVLFERATEAYLVLSDPERRARYTLEVPPPTSSQSTRTEIDPARTKEMARELFQQAKEMVGREEYHYAYELLKRAVQLDRQSEYFGMLADVQQRNPKWLHHAADSLREAVLLDPQNSSLRLSLASVFERLGDRQRAIATYRSILVRYPNHEEAQQAMKRLDKGKPMPASGSAAAEAPKKGGFLGLFRRK
jgi:tetratricopeptide (TPR) repeat protein